ncbi:TIGR02530 family flagellar biosynthesis protein [Bacillus andreraoultii]|uniref:TIGR02530 family flagellar biosynthesis protein n=1 Tax=Bacillus andreraoultii TaxID=1499685 RepID=UPI0009E3B221|nr:TIGR02530 family flagellar biosynthesis protein [Bacillus andreraoultii]
MHIQKSFIPPIGIQNTQRKNNQAEQIKTNQSFASHLQESVQEQTNLTISKHAKLRLAEREINISSDDWKKIDEKLNQARKMGVNESLVLLDQAALIVSAKNNTVITAMDRTEASSQIFTNINGTIII